jgi:hypothetical protein
MKLIQVSPRQLICEDDTYRQNITAWFILCIWGAILALFMMINGLRSSLGYFACGLVVMFLVLPVLGISTVYGELSHYTATIDLDLECIEIKQHWPLSGKRRIQQSPISLIATIGATESNSSSYQVVWRQHDGTVVVFGNSYTEERSRAEADAEIIRSFLNQDGRDIEIG